MAMLVPVDVATRRFTAAGGGLPASLGAAHRAQQGHRWCTVRLWLSAFVGRRWQWTPVVQIPNNLGHKNYEQAHLLIPHGETDARQQHPQ